MAPGGCVAAGACVVGGEVKGACVSALGASVVVGDSDGGLVLEGRGVGGYPGASVGTGKGVGLRDGAPVGIGAGVGISDAVFGWSVAPGG